MESAVSNHLITALIARRPTDRGETEVEQGSGVSRPLRYQQRLVAEVIWMTRRNEESLAAASQRELLSTGLSDSDTHDMQFGIAHRDPRIAEASSDSEPVE
jgi:hypothetical protein